MSMTEITGLATVIDQVIDATFESGDLGIVIVYDLLIEFDLFELRISSYSETLFQSLRVI